MKNNKSGGTSIHCGSINGIQKCLCTEGCNRDYNNSLLDAIKPTCEVAGSKEAPEFGCSSQGSLPSKSIEPSVVFVEYEYYGSNTNATSRQIRG